MPYKARVVTSWVRVGPVDRIKIAADQPFPGVAHTDVTGQPDTSIVPVPNAFVVEINPLTEAQLAALEADSGCLVLWSEEIVNGF